MTNWVITQTPRFRAAVAVASVSNLISFYATSLYQDLVHAEFNGFPWAADNFTNVMEVVAAGACRAGGDADDVPARRKRQRRPHHSGRGDVHGAARARDRIGAGAVSARGAWISRGESTGSTPRRERWTGSTRTRSDAGQAQPDELPLYATYRVQRRLRNLPSRIPPSPTAISTRYPVRGRQPREDGRGRIRSR